MSKELENILGDMIRFPEKLAVALVGWIKDVKDLSHAAGKIQSEGITQ